MVKCKTINFAEANQQGVPIQKVINPFIWNANANMFSVDDIYMQRALDLAAKGIGHVSPNPLVGAVLVHDDLVIGEGYHECFGQAHAEINCLNAVRDEHKHLIPVSTMYVTLEPCAHHGKTPPCAVRLVNEGLKAVVIAILDPNPAVNGKGAALLRQAGIEVRMGVMEAEAKYQNRRFISSCISGRPYITLKWAQTADGFIGSGTENRIRITCHQSDILVHKWRSEEDAIMIGSRTALLDDPLLNNRYVDGASPLRVVLDRNDSLPKTLKMFNDGNPVVVVNSHKEGVEGNIRYKKISADGEMWKDLLAFLHELNIQGLMVEGGAEILKAMIAGGYWNEIRVFTNTALNISSGIAAPLLPTNISIVDQHHIGSDLLNIYLKGNQ